MKTYLDTNILYNKHSGKEKDLNIKRKFITSINALEFLKNIEKKHHNKAKYHIPYTNNHIHQMQFVRMKKSNYPFSKRYSDSIVFDFSQDFESYTLYNNKSISQVINNKGKELFYSSIEFLDKPLNKDIKNKFKFILENKLNCDILKPEDIELSYDLLTKFLKKYSLKADFRNCWNDILILARCINEGAKLHSSDNLLNTFTSEVYNGKIQKTENGIEIEFPKNNENSENTWTKNQSKGYINRGWQYKMNK
ncbi:MAG: hypothetical protein WBG46_04340 [Nonlabens sp.]